MPDVPFAEQLRSLRGDALWDVLAYLAKRLVRRRHGRHAKTLIIETTDGETIRLPLPHVVRRPR